MRPDPDEAVGQLMLARWRAELDRTPAQPLKPAAPPERLKPGVRRETHIKLTRQRWAAH
jgi:hypothetical protein